jgi:hypothetical protein
MSAKYELPKNTERYLATLSKLYASEGERKLQEILVNAQVRIHEAWTSDNWNGGTYGHALFLAIPESLFLRSVKTRADIQKRICADINKLHNFQNESIDEVFLEMEAAEHRNWRKDSGVLLTGKRVVLPDATKRIWGDPGYRVFLTHKSKVKAKASKLKDSLRTFGISAFVAHKDIRPTKEWRDEIENALSTMDALVALMTDGFHESEWTDQEIGYAFGRGVPIIAVRLGVDPYGFIGKFQALSCTWKEASVEIVKLLVQNERMLNFYLQAVRDCTGWIEGNYLAEVLPAMETLSDKQADLLIEAYNESDEVRGSWGFNGTRPSKYGDGLLSHLKRLTQRTYKETSSGKIKVVS